MFAIIHHSVMEYSIIMLLELKRYNYVTPTNYLELVNVYKEYVYIFLCFNIIFIILIILYII